MDIETITLIISIIGASAWLAPYAYDKLKTIELVGKLVSIIVIDDMETKDNTTGTVVSAGILYIFKLSITALGGNFHPKSVETDVTYEDGTKLRGKILIPRNIHTDVNGVLNKIAPPRELLFPNICVFQEGTAQHVYMPIAVDRATKGVVKKVKFWFTDFKGRTNSVEIDFDKINQGELMFEEIFHPIKDS